MSDVLIYTKGYDPNNIAPNTNQHAIDVWKNKHIWGSGKYNENMLDDEYCHKIESEKIYEDIERSINA